MQDCTSRTLFLAAPAVRDQPQVPFQLLPLNRNRCRKSEKGSTVKPCLSQTQIRRRQPRTTPNRKRSVAYVRDDPTGHRQTRNSTPSCHDEQPRATAPLQLKLPNRSEERRVG